MSGDKRNNHDTCAQRLPLPEGERVGERAFSLQ